MPETLTLEQEIKRGIRTKKGTLRPKVHFDDKDPDSRSKCEQHHITDINQIMKIKPNAAQRERMADEIDQAQDFVNMANAVPEEEFVKTYSKAREIEHEFTKRVRPEVREKFGNSALKFAKAYADPKNKEEFIKMGLMKPDPFVPTEEQIKEAEIARKAKAAAEAKWIADYKAANPS